MKQEGDDEIFADLGPIENYDDKIEQQNDSILKSIDNYQSHQEQLVDYDIELFQKIVVSPIPKIKEVYLQFANLINLSQELTILFGLQDLFTLRTTQLVKLCLIGQLQITQIVEKLANPYTDILRAFQLTALNESMITQVLSYLHIHLLPQIKLVCQSFFIKKHQKSPKSILVEFRYFLAQLHTVLETFPCAAAIPVDSILSLPKTDIQWQALQPYIHVVCLGTKEELQKSYSQIITAIESAQAMFMKKDETHAKVFRGLLHNLGALYYMISRKEGHKKAQCLQADPKVEMAFAVWNMGEKGLIKSLMPIILPSIKYKHIIHVERYFMRISKEYIKESELQRGIIDPPRHFIISQPILRNFQQLKGKDQDQVRIRVLNSHPFQKDPSYYVNPQYSGGQSKQGAKVYEKLVIHIHGGGFVAMSSRSHQNYTRIWANLLECPIFSIDYRLSPKHAFPAALDDVWQSYLWILHFSINFFNILPKKIVLVGDSAGGNLCAALTCLCIRENVRIPDAILLAYPALDLNPKNFTMSQYISLNDGLLPHTFLKLCQNAYVQDDFDCTNPLISPVYANNEILSKFPKTVIMTGTNDPLHDDTWRFLQKLIQSNRECRLELYTDMPHGLLSFDPIMPQSATCVRNAATILQELLG